MKTPKKYKNMEYLWLIQGLVSSLEPKVYMEIGVKDGYTFNAISPVVEKAIGIDIADSRKIIKSSNVEFFQMDSAAFVKQWVKREDTNIDFLFIDADHRYESVLKDFQLLSPFVAMHTGLIFLHDTFPIKEELLSDGYCSSAWKAAAHIHDLEKKFEIVTLPGPWAGLSIIRKVDRSHGWMDNASRWEEVK